MKESTMYNMCKVVRWVSLLMVAIFVVKGCRPTDVSLLEEGKNFEKKGKYIEAEEEYSASAALGNAEAMRKLGDLNKMRVYNSISQITSSLSLENLPDDSSWYDMRLSKAKVEATRAKHFYDKMQKAGCTSQIQSSLTQLAKCEAEIAGTESRIGAAKAKAEEEAERRAEEARRNSPEYCIDNNIELSPAALKEVVRAITFSSRTGNKIYDREENIRNHNRFMNKTIIVRGSIREVGTTFFTGEVKLIVDVPEATISALFEGMSQEEAMELKVGESITFEGQITNRAVLSTFAMDQCRLK